jgi:SAM-dependent methyltransferase
MDAPFSPATVARGYDALAGRYARWADRVSPPLRERYAADLTSRLPPGARVLDLGCGPGVPVARLLDRRHAVIGVDISWEMVLLARQNVPQGRFVQGDMGSIAFRPGMFDAVVAFHSLIHVPRVQHPTLFDRMGRWLRPGGLLVASLGARDLPVGTDPNWLGSGPMSWSFFDAETNLRLLTEAGLAMEEAKVLGQSEDGEPVEFLWVVAHRPGVAGVGS